MTARNYGVQKLQRLLCIAPRSANGNTFKFNSAIYVDGWSVGTRPAYQRENLLLSMSALSMSVNSNPGRPPQFEIPEMTIEVNNFDNVFHYSHSESIFYGTYGRKHALIGLQIPGQIARDGTINSLLTYVGLINDFEFTDRYTAIIKVVSFFDVFTRIPISELGLTGIDTVSNTVNDILTSTVLNGALQVYFPGTNVISVPAGNNYNIDRSNLTGTVWDVLTNLAFWANCNMYLTYTNIYTPPAFNFKARSSVRASGITLFGPGGYGDIEIDSIRFLDDEGSKRLVLSVIDESTSPATVLSTASSDERVKKFLLTPLVINLSYVDSASKNTVMTSILNEWSEMRRIIDVTCSLNDSISLLSSFNISMPSLSYVGMVWDRVGDNWDVKKWVDEAGGTIIENATSWLVTSITYDLTNYKMTIRGEEIV